MPATCWRRMNIYFKQPAVCWCVIRENLNAHLFSFKLKTIQNQPAGMTVKLGIRCIHEPQRVG